ncbi:CBS domain-containing protein [Edaphobacter albus]|uniref:CBS domain-containing protein n=1 Tax=Edaphobacter sp. 4G125 TaxID=2763071 RepID=UPI00164572DE|nr:CBS domain-containing protein [Edaphobacter sp. 4G125]QNI35547.1 CBS domain-containing protein [Edaphobacter sp. 4G125]
MSELASTVGAVLKKKSRDIWSATPDTSVYRCMEIMAEREIGALLVMQENDLIGVISERDYARKVILQGRSSKETAASEIMSSPALCVSPEHTIGDCMLIMTRNRIRHLPVREGSKVIGVVSIGDLVNWIITEQEETIRHLEAYICSS